jgi:hypothetical protein
MSSYFDALPIDSEPPVALEDLPEEVEETPVTVEEETLLTRGYFSSTATLGTNKIVLRTLKIGEELEVAVVANKYKDTIEATRALITATVAASIVSVNERPLIVFQLGQADGTLEAKFLYVLNN